MILRHATLRRYLPGIERQGLLCAPLRSAFALFAVKVFRLTAKGAKRDANCGQQRVKNWRPESPRCIHTRAHSFILSC